jgi:hypothetical protein
MLTEEILRRKNYYSYVNYGYNYVTAEVCFARLNSQLNGDVKSNPEDKTFSYVVRVLDRNDYNNMDIFTEVNVDALVDEFNVMLNGVFKVSVDKYYGKVKDVAVVFHFTELGEFHRFTRFIFCTVISVLLRAIDREFNSPILRQLKDSDRSIETLEDIIYWRYCLGQGSGHGINDYFRFSNSIEFELLKRAYINTIKKLCNNFTFEEIQDTLLSQTSCYTTNYGQTPCYDYLDKTYVSLRDKYKEVKDED